MEPEAQARAVSRRAAAGAGDDDRGRGRRRHRHRHRARRPGTDLPFEDDSFDIAFSNAVLEHVGDREEQRRFVHELCRVAPRVFVSTPNGRFPVEVHTLVPFLHWLPRGARNRAFAALRRDAWRGVELLNRRELLELFPPGARPRIVESRMTISVVADRVTK